MTSRLQKAPERLNPMMSKAEIELFTKYINKANKYLEYGSGGSTYLASLNPYIEIVSVESLQTWIDKCSKLKTIKRLLAVNKMKFHYIDYNAGDECGMPLDNTKADKFSTYSDIIAEYPPNTFDTVLIDGRFRVACACKLYAFIEDSTRILFHDYMERPEYRCIEDFYTIVEVVDTMAVLKKKENIDKSALVACMKKYETNPQ